MHARLLDEGDVAVGDTDGFVGKLVEEVAAERAPDGHDSKLVRTLCPSLEKFP